MMSHVTAAGEGVEVKEGLFLTQQQLSVTQLVLFFQAMDQRVVEWSAKLALLPRPPIPPTRSTDCRRGSDVRRRTQQPGCRPACTGPDLPSEHVAIASCQAPTPTAGKGGGRAPTLGQMGFCKHFTLPLSPHSSGSPASQEPSSAAPRAHSWSKAASPTGPAPS